MCNFTRPYILTFLSRYLFMINTLREKTLNQLIPSGVYFFLMNLRKRNRHTQRAQTSMKSCLRSMKQFDRVQPSRSCPKIEKHLDPGVVLKHHPALPVPNNCSEFTFPYRLTKPSKSADTFSIILITNRQTPIHRYLLHNRRRCRR